MAYAAYVEFCKKNRLIAWNKIFFGKQMKASPHYKEDIPIKHEGKTYRVWNGIKLKQEYLSVVREMLNKVHKDEQQQRMDGYGGI